MRYRLICGRGEATGGLHGKNRIGGNAVADIIIYGRQSGNQASEYVKSKLNINKTRRL